MIDEDETLVVGWLGDLPPNSRPHWFLLHDHVVADIIARASEGEDHTQIMLDLWNRGYHTDLDRMNEEETSSVSEDCIGILTSGDVTPPYDPNNEDDLFNGQEQGEDGQEEGAA